MLHFALLCVSLVQHSSGGDVPYKVLSVREADGGAGGMYTATIIGGDGLPATSSYDPESNRIRFVHCHDANCTRVSSQLLGQGGRTQAMVTSSSGLPLLGFCNSDNFFEVISCRTFNCTAHASYPTSGRCGMYTAAHQGVKRAAFVFSGADASFVVRCSDGTCSSVTAPRQIPSSGTGYPAVAVLANDLPVIAFIDKAKKPASLNLAICDADDCQSLSIRALGKGGVDYAYSAMTIVDSLPVVLAAREPIDGRSYMEVYVCKDVACVSNMGIVLEASGPSGKGSYGEFPHIVATAPWLKAEGVDFAAVYYNTMDSSKGVARLAMCSAMLDCQLHTVASGSCGYGRDASIAFTEDRAYYSCMKYSSVASERRSMLAILQIGRGSDLGVSLGGHTDICASSHASETIQI